MPNAKWYKGNIHTHTNESDGDVDPAKVVSWYRRHGYDFLVLSDHNHVTMFEYGAGKRQFRRPLMIPGEEVSANVNAGGDLTPIHIGAIGVLRLVEPIDAGDIVSTIQANVDAILDAGGIPSLNHPNFRWAFDHTHITQVRGARLMEVYNGHPLTNSDGAPGRSSGDEIWDGVLSADQVIFGVATDDSHTYTDYSPRVSNPGRGWLMVRAEEFSKEAIVDSIATGEFYASTGVTLSELEISAESIRIVIEQEFDVEYVTTFTGKNGVKLAEAAGLEAGYDPRGDEGYVRATVRCSQPGSKAWTQPVFLSRT